MSFQDHSVEFDTIKYRTIIEQLEDAINQIKPFVLGGRTGTGKTLLLNNLKQQVDLEAIFNHRGSAFGQYATPQPTQINIENHLAIELLKHTHLNHDKLLFEDESCNIGSRELPRSLYSTMSQSPLDERINNVFQEYIIESLQQHQFLAGNEKGFDKWQQTLEKALEKIQRRLGGVRYQELKHIMQNAFNAQLSTDDPEQHKEWIKILLVDYYDPMYDYQLSKKTERIIFRGNNESVLEFLQHEHGIV